jgi:S-adenosylmethionine:tRNA ribosyltransferase-isomerase
MQREADEFYGVWKTCTDEKASKKHIEDFLQTYGTVPLPPYISDTQSDVSRYQTVYAEKTGSAAAPTAGLHFSKELLSQITELGITLIKIDLAIGPGTFLPVKTESIKDHHMHKEVYTIDPSAAETLNQTKKNKQRIICVGTTSLRALESNYTAYNNYKAETSSTDIFIKPPMTVSSADCLITNFHLPKSTLLMLVSSFAGIEHIRSAYQQAIEHDYRFFSFGDAMFIQ